MKSILALMMLTFSLNSFATGGFFCEAKIKTSKEEVRLQVIGRTSFDLGHPLTDSLVVSVNDIESLQVKIPKAQVVGYWNDSEQLLVSTVNKKGEYSQLILKYNLKKEKGTIEVNFQGTETLTSKKVKCNFE